MTPPAHARPQASARANSHASTRTDPQGHTSAQASPQAQTGQHAHARQHASAHAPASRTRATLRGKILLVIYFAIAIAAALFGLSVVKPAPQQVNDVDVRGFQIVGTQDMVTGDYFGTVDVGFASGAKYTGEVEEDGFTGSGSYTGAGGWSISGVFTDGYLEDTGTYSDDKGSYEGSFTKSLPNGQGTYTSTEGWKYVGDFVGGKVTGTGKVVFDDGSELEGTFENGVLQEAL